ncbi:hypothetical protein Tco_0039681 [Tanacetum coccineum]
MGSSPFWITGTIRPESGWENSGGADMVKHVIEIKSLIPFMRSRIFSKECLVPLCGIANQIAKDIRVDRNLKEKDISSLNYHKSSLNCFRSR